MDEALNLIDASQDFWQKGELDNSLEALDQAYESIIQVDTYDSPKLIQQKEDLRFTISKRILEIYASRNTVITGVHKEIPLSIDNKHVQAEIDLLARGRERDFFIRAYKRSGQYRPLIVDALKKAGLPVEFSWLPLIESGFNATALSKSRALGLWQFIPSTGYKFGLQRDTFIDERIDPVKSTKGAIEYLKALHQIFGDWTTVLAAYNCGEGRVLRLIRSQNINYLDNFWDLYEKLPTETARYVPRFLATIHIVNNLKKYDLDNIPLDSPLEYEIITVSKQVHLKDVADQMNLPVKILKKLNPELRYSILPDVQYPLRVPPGKGAELLAKLDNMPVSSKPRPEIVYHRIVKGENLSTIARKYDTSINRIIRTNGLSEHSLIVAGKILKIPQKGYLIPTAKESAAPPPPPTIQHTVKSGDSLWLLALKYDTKVKNILETNNLDATHLFIGQNLTIPVSGTVPDVRETRPRTAGPPARLAGPSPAKRPAPTVKRYQVKKGDSLWIIARQHDTRVREILTFNNLASTELKINQILQIPVPAPSPMPRQDEPKAYRVKQGDTLYTIAQKNRIPFKKLLSINQLTPKSKIFPGQKLLLE
ncbi:MAG: LysM peptidoglycan-binding domain-containing protein [Desulfobacterales bacterium]|nr:LysM peptidoglycan-binding domain-containing protein [Desulfobacterales bacterium]